MTLRRELIVGLFAATGVAAVGAVLIQKSSPPGVSADDAPATSCPVPQNNPDAVCVNIAHNMIRRSDRTMDLQQTMLQPRPNIPAIEASVRHDDRAIAALKADVKSGKVTPDAQGWAYR